MMQILDTSARIAKFLCPMNLNPMVTFLPQQYPSEAFDYLFHHSFLASLVILPAVLFILFHLCSFSSPLSVSHFLHARFSFLTTYASCHCTRVFLYTTSLG
jgi:hypothetical protein